MNDFKHNNYNVLARKALITAALLTVFLLAACVNSTPIETIPSPTPAQPPTHTAIPEPTQVQKAPPRAPATHNINHTMPNERLLEYEIFLATNAEREKRGLTPLYLDEKLSAVAQGHSKDMLRRDFFDYVNPEGEDATARAERHNIPTPLGIGENIASIPYDDMCSDKRLGFSGYCFVELWTDSVVTRSSIIDENYGVIGIGVACSDTECYATQNFNVVVGKGGLFDERLLEYEIFLATNAEREKRGLTSLYLDEKLSAVAQDHSRDMLQRDFFDHTNPDGEDATARAERLDIPTKLTLLDGLFIYGIGENIALLHYDGMCSDIHPGFSGYCFVDLWMDSPGHRAAILDEDYGVIGIGVACSDTACYATQNFRAGGEGVLPGNNEDRIVWTSDDDPHTIIITHEDRRVILGDDQDPSTHIITDEDRIVVGSDDDPQTYIITDEDRQVIWGDDDDPQTYIITDKDRKIISGDYEDPHTHIITDKGRSVFTSDYDPQTHIVTNDDNTIWTGDEDPQTIIITDENKDVSYDISGREITYTVR